MSDKQIIHLEHSSYWRGKVRVFEQWTNGGDKQYTAEYRAYQSWFPNKGWRSVTTSCTGPAGVFADLKSAADAAKAEWERLDKPRVSYRRKIWP